MPHLLDEWPARREVLERVLRLLASHEAMTAKDLADKLGHEGLPVQKRLVNSVLFSEGRRYVTYDRATHRYRLRVVDEQPGRFGELDVANTLGPPRATHPANNTNRGAAAPASRAGQLHARMKIDGLAFELSVSDEMEQALFVGAQRGSRVSVKVNRGHVAYALIRDHVEAPDACNDPSSGHPQRHSSSIVEAFFFAWAAYEHSLPEGSRIREYASEARVEWGRQLRRFVSPGDGD